jgi:drug/metabolite transporter (DMT)-like permease
MVDQIASVRAARRQLDTVALTAGLLAPVTWGLTGACVRLLHGLPTLTIVTVRLAVAALVLVPWTFARRDKFPQALRSPLALAMGGYYIFATEAFVRAPVVDVTLLVGTAPVIAVGLEQLRGRSPVRQQVIGAMVAVLGLVMFLRPGSRIGNEQAFGYIFALCAAAASATYAVGLRARAQTQQPLDPLVLTLLACVLGAVVSSFLELRTLLMSALPTPSPAQSAYLAILGCVCTAIPTLAFGVASTRLPSVLTTSLGLMTPLFAALFAGLLLDEWPAPAAVPGALMAIAGVVIVLRAPTQPTRSA